MLIYVFLPHYQLVCVNSYTSSFSLISYERIVALLQGESVGFAQQKLSFLLPF